MLTVNNRTYGLAHSANVLIALGLIAALALALLLG
jgi:hypothetical protein